jgi:hypothetical protein
VFLLKCVSVVENNLVFVCDVVFGVLCISCDFEHIFAHNSCTYCVFPTYTLNNTFLPLLLIASPTVIHF